VLSQSVCVPCSLSRESAERKEEKEVGRIIYTKQVKHTKHINNLLNSSTSLENYAFTRSKYTFQK